MLDNIKLTSYNQGNSLFHKLNPITKIVIALLFSIFTLIQNNIYITLILTLLTIINILLSNTSILKILKITKSVCYLMIFLLIMYLIEGLSLEIYTISVLKLLLVMICSNIVIVTTSLPDINNGLYHILKWLKVFNKNLPNIIALMLTLSIRFIPTILDKANNILKAQKSRGISIKGAPLRNKLTIISSFLKIMLNSTIDDADELAEMIEIRKYNISNFQAPGSIPPLAFIDYFLIISYLVILVLIIRGVIL